MAIGTAITVDTNPLIAAPIPAICPRGCIAKARRFPNKKPIEKPNTKEPDSQSQIDNFKELFKRQEEPANELVNKPRVKKIKKLKGRGKTARRTGFTDKQLREMERRINKKKTYNRELDYKCSDGGISLPISEEEDKSIDIKKEPVEIKKKPNKQKKKLNMKRYILIKKKELK